ncbi:MAG: cupredoxin domain-containing protein [Candidatus Limnocylindria bacterium]
MRRIVAAAMAATLVISACGGGGAGGGAGPAAELGPAVETSEVSLEDRKFVPASIMVAAGTTVTWSNKDRMAHTVTSGVPRARDRRFDRTLSPGTGTFTFTFEEPGVYTYFCQFHPATMLGQVEVK